MKDFIISAVNAIKLLFVYYLFIIEPANQNVLKKDSF